MNFLLAQSQTDLAGRIAQFSEQFPAWMLLLGGLGLLAFLQLALSHRAFWLIPIYLLMCMFSGHTISQLDTGSTLIRWWLIVCFCAAAIRSHSYPGEVCVMLGLYWFFAIISSLWSPNFGGGIQMAGLSLAMTLGASASISALVSDVFAARKVLEWYVLMSVIFIINGTVNIGQIGGGRFAGANESAGLFVITGGLLMPTLLWGFHALPGFRRIACLVGFAIVSSLCLLSGQRTGFYAGIIACIPFVIQFESKHLVRGLVALALVIAVGFAAIQLFPQQTDFLTERYLETDKQGNVSVSTDASGRQKRWLNALAKINRQPVIGHGVGADKKAGIGGFHNAYLQEWYNGGAAGVLLFFGASVLALYQTFRLMTNNWIDPELSQMGRLLFSWMVVLFLSSFFESKLASPSNIMAFTMVLISVLAYRLHMSSIDQEPFNQNTRANRPLYFGRNR